MSENAIFFRHLRDQMPKGTNGLTAMVLSSLETKVDEVDRAKAGSTCAAHVPMADLGVATAQISAISLMEEKTTQATVKSHGDVLEAIQRDVKAMAKRTLPRWEYEAARGEGEPESIESRRRGPAGTLRVFLDWLTDILGGVNLKTGAVRGVAALLLIVLVVRGEQRIHMQQRLIEELNAVQNETKQIGEAAAKARVAATNAVAKVEEAVRVLEENL